MNKLKALFLGSIAARQEQAGEEAGNVPVGALLVEHCGRAVVPTVLWVTNTAVPSMCPCRVRGASIVRRQPWQR